MLRFACRPFDGKVWAAMQRVNSRGAPTYAIADHFIDENVLAVIVRDPGTAPGCKRGTEPAAEHVRMIIVPADACDDTPACFGEATLRQDEMRLFNAPARRVLTIFADRRVRLETTDDSGAACVRWRQSTVTVYNVRNNTMRRIRRLTAEVGAEEITRVGTIRIAPPRGSSAWSAWDRWIDTFNSALGRAAADLVQADPSLIGRARKWVHRAKDIVPVFMREEIQTWEHSPSLAVS